MRVVGTARTKIPRRWSVAILPFVALGLLSGCNTLDQLLDVELPGQIAANDAESPSKATALVEGAITVFNCALGKHVHWGGFLGDELTSGGGNFADIQARAFRSGSQWSTAEDPNCASYYGAVAEARWLTDRTLTLLQGWTDAEVAGRSTLIARAAAYAGYSHLLLAEGFCTAAIDNGPEIQSADVFQRAEARFTEAITAATTASNNETLNLARVGRARARLGLGASRLADARTDAALVPAGYVKLALFPATLPGINDNYLYVRTHLGRNMAVKAAYYNVQYAGRVDPRINVLDTGFETSTGPAKRLYVPVKYNSAASPIQIATWEEAQLIVAEAQIVAGNLPAAVAIINQLHTNAGLAAFNSSDPNEVRQQLIYERRAELFLEGQHIGDYRRLQLPFTPPPGTAYTDVPGLTWGNFRCYPLPASERASNPSID